MDDGTVEFLLRIAQAQPDRPPADVTSAICRLANIGFERLNTRFRHVILRPPAPLAFLDRLILHLLGARITSAKAIDAYTDDPEFTVFIILFAVAERRRDLQTFKPHVPDEQARANPPPPRTLIAKGSNYHLEELVHPRHLVEESRRLQHCLGLVPYHASSTETVRDPYHLAYWQAIASNNSRIFSFAYRKKTVATIEVSLCFPTPTVCQIGLMRSHSVNGTEPYFGLLLMALDDLRLHFGGSLKYVANVRERLRRAESTAAKTGVNDNTDNN